MVHGVPIKNCLLHSVTVKTVHGDKSLLCEYFQEILSLKALIDCVTMSPRHMVTTVVRFSTAVPMVS